MKFYKITLLLLLFGFSMQTYAQKKSKTKTLALNAEAYRSFTPDGAWCWFSDPRAVYFEGAHKRTYAGWIDSYGDIVVGVYDHDSGKITTKVLYDGFEIDDHDNPSLLIDKRGFIYVFFTSHNGIGGIYMSKSRIPENIEGMSQPTPLQINEEDIIKRYGDKYTYVNLAYLTEEDRLYLFWRSADGKPTFSTSVDAGKSWEMGKEFIVPDRAYSFKRPYVKVATNGTDKIGFTFTDGHPRKEKENSVYFMYMKNGYYYKADGTKIKRLDDGPIKPKQTDLVHKADTISGKTWVWDVAFDANDKPTIAYVRFPSDSSHVYRYGKWTGKKWNSYDLVDSGKWFPKTPKEVIEPEPNYSGGIALDHENPNTIYLSVNRDSIFEIEKWQTTNEGKSWEKHALTKGSSKDNVRPFAVRNAKEGNPMQVLWVMNSFYEHYTKYQSAIQTSIPFNRKAIDPWSKKGIMEISEQVANWQIINPIPRKWGVYKDYRQQGIDWIWGAFHTGLWDFYKKSGKEVYKEHIKNTGQNHGWRPENAIFNADNHTFFQQAIELSKEEPNKDYLKDFQWVLDIHLGRDPNGPENLFHNKKDTPYHHEWWTWCDALYMSPQAFAKMSDYTGDAKYLDYAIKYWKKTADYLYSPEEALFYRDYNYFDKLTDNGKKIFWSRGNGWVLAGLARLIPFIPEDHPERGYFIEQYKQMAARIASLQNTKDGMWRVSLLDPKYLDQGESSGTAFFTWALAWGINADLLDKTTYLPVVKRGWIALCNNVNAEGRLGYVQQVAASPYPFYENEYHLYASGAFLGAGMEILEIVE